MQGWVWSDYVWHHPEPFFRNMPHSVLQSNWYYDADFGPEVRYANAYKELEAHGYDQVPTGSNWTTPDSLPLTVRYCREHIAPERLKGFLQTVWKPTLEVERARHLEAIEALARAKG